MSLSPNSTLAHYTIVSKLGAGGMGEVYLAEDSRLQRKVALKILPSEMATNQDRMRRFKQEATAAAALNHPNIAHIYEIGESDSTNFIAMEFVEGVTLRDKIHRERTDLKSCCATCKRRRRTGESSCGRHCASRSETRPLMITRDGHAKILRLLSGKTESSHNNRRALLMQARRDATAILQQHSTPDDHGYGRLHVARRHRARRKRSISVPIFSRLAASCSRLPQARSHLKVIQSSSRSIAYL